MEPPLRSVLESLWCEARRAFPIRHHWDDADLREYSEPRGAHTRAPDTRAYADDSTHQSKIGARSIQLSSARPPPRAFGELRKGTASVRALVWLNSTKLGANRRAGF